MNNKRAEELIKKYLDNTCTPEEEALLESWYIKNAAHDEPSPGTPDYFELEREIWTELKKRKHRGPKPNWLIMGAAAACVVICSAVFFMYRDTDIRPERKFSAVKIMPGGNKAELILADGSKIALNDASNGILANQSGIKVKKLHEGLLNYDAGQGPADTSLNYNVLVTPKGGQYQVILPDGTKVWLNAASSLRFPIVFRGNERVVEVSGEAYFEVVSNKQKPFKVKSPGQVIEVLGTHFNVSAYSDEVRVKTSLMEGSVKVSTALRKVIIKPGEQTIFDTKSQHIRVQPSVSEDVLAWKNGYFQFSDEDIEGIMRKIARWYDVDVVYHKDFASQRFAGAISRFEDVSKVLRMLELTGSIHFKIEGRRIIVMP